MALMDLALEAGDKTCARQYSETAEQAGRVFQLTAYAVASAPLQLALAEQDGPEALAVLERLLRSLEEPWDLSASPLYRHLPTKEATREVQQIMLPISAGGTGAGPGIRFPPGDPRIPGDAGGGSTGQKYR